jgi:monoamine oxidase
MPSSLTRRHFLQLAGAAGGSASAYRMALGLGLAPLVKSAERPDLAPLDPGIKRTIVILGAGISGLTAAYELRRKGYDVTILEASHRAGGRNNTLRRGDLIDEIGNPRRCEFDDDPDLYFNAGPARLPGHHQTILGYCKELGVALTPFINDNRNAWVQDDAMFDGRRIRNREFMNDSHGFIAELAAKSIKPEALDAPFSRGDYNQVLEYLRQFGDLDSKFRYQGSLRAGIATSDHASPLGMKKPLDPSVLIRSSFINWMHFGEGDDQAAMMMEPVGGMDGVVKGFLRKVGSLVKLHCMVHTIQLLPEGVRVDYLQSGHERSIRADYVLNCIPSHLLSALTHNFPADYAAALAAIPRGKLFKIGFQCKQRFWEKESIYGGISWTTQDIMQMWYPSHGIHRQKGVILGMYTFDAERGDRFSAMSHAARIEAAIQQGEKLHPGYRSQVEHGVSVPWQNMNHMQGCAAEWDEALYAQYFRTVQAPVGNHYMIGDQISYSPGWQEGAMHSAHHALADISRRERERNVTRVRG